MCRYGSMLTLYHVWFDGMMLGTEWNDRENHEIDDRFHLHQQRPFISPFKLFTGGLRERAPCERKIISTRRGTFEKQTRSCPSLTEFTGGLRERASCERKIILTRRETFEKQTRSCPSLTEFMQARPYTSGATPLDLAYKPFHHLKRRPFVTCESQGFVLLPVLLVNMIDLD
jgi:hypothetical protein